MGLRKSKIIQDKYKIENVIPKGFSFIAPFTSVAMSVAKYVLPETAIFAAKLIHHKERDKSSPGKFPNFNNPLASSIEAGNYTFIFKEATSQYDRLVFLGEMRK